MFSSNVANSKSKKKNNETKTFNNNKAQQKTSQQLYRSSLYKTFDFNFLWFY